MRSLLAVFPLVMSLAQAAPTPENAGKVQVPADILKEFQIVEQLAAQSNYAEAARKAQALLPRLSDSPAGRALLLHNLATLYGLQKHYAHAAMILQECLSLKALPANEDNKARFELGQYYAAAESFEEAAEALDSWLNSARDPKPEQLLLLADIRMRLNQYAAAAKLIDQAIDRSSAPKEAWFQTLLGLYHEVRDFPSCIRVLTHLIDRFPDNPQYWNQLTAVYQEAGKDRQALAVQQLMYAKGFLKLPAQILQLTEVMRFTGLHSRAAELLETEIEKGGVERNPRNLARLASAWVEAKELGKAAAALEKSVKLADSSDTLHRLGQIYSELHDWAKARQALSRAIASGRLTNPGGAYLLLGLANYRLDAKDQARKAFLKAQDSQAVRKTAQQWLEHLDKEKPSQQS